MQTLGLTYNMPQNTGHPNICFVCFLWLLFYPHTNAGSHLIEIRGKSNVLIKSFIKNAPHKNQPTDYFAELPCICKIITNYTRESIAQFLHNKPAFHNWHTIVTWCW